jgi:hypothetical protein
MRAVEAVQIETTEEGLALHSLGLLAAEQISDLALLFMGEGCDGLEMAALAGSGAGEHPADLRKDLERAVRAAGRVIPDRISAAKLLRRACARRGAAGTTALRESARAVIEIFQRVQDELPNTGQYLGEEFGIARLVGVYYSYDDVASDDWAAIQEIDGSLRTALAELAEPSVDE